MISACISDDILPQMKILNMVIPILMHFCSYFSNWSIASSLKPAVIHQNVIKIFLTVFPSLTLYSRIYCHKYFTLSNQMLRYKIKCIRISKLSLLWFGLRVNLMTANISHPLSSIFLPKSWKIFQNLSSCCSVCDTLWVKPDNFIFRRSCSLESFCLLLHSSLLYTSI